MQPQKGVVFVIVTTTEDVTLQCATSLLRLQQAAARRVDVHLDIHIVSSLLEALNVPTGNNEWLVIADANCGVPDSFVFQAVDSDKDMVLGVYPLPRVDWERVKTYQHTTDQTDQTEPVQHIGNTYNVVPKNASYGRYVGVKTVRDAKVVCLRIETLKSLAGPHTQTDTIQLFTHDAAFTVDGSMQYHTPYQTLVKRVIDAGKSVVADIESQCTISGNAQFAGCVGARGFVR